MSFYRYMMRNYRDANSPEGDLARDMEKDREHFPLNGKGKYAGWHRLIREHLERRNACDACLAVFEHCWQEYVEFCRRRK